MAILLLLLAIPAAAGQRPIIDMHFHVLRFTGASVVGAAEETLRRHNIVKAVTSGPAEEVRELAARVPDRVLASPLFPAIPDDFGTPKFAGRREWPPIDSLRAAYREGRYRAMAEITSQYVGLAADAPELEPYFALAEELDVPVGIHLSGLGAPGFPAFRSANGNPLRLEEVLARHPKLRLYVMHAGWPYADEMKALMTMHRNVYAEVATINWLIPRAEFHAYLEELIRAGFGKRIMFGSDFWGDPAVMQKAIDGVESAPFLTDEQKRDIFHDNAARFLRLPSK